MGNAALGSAEAAKGGKVVPEHGSEDEKQLAREYCLWYTKTEKKSATTMFSFTNALCHRPMNDTKSDNHYARGRRWRTFVKGLVRAGDGPRIRFPWPAELAMDLITYANEERKSLEVAVQIVFAYFGPVRSGHFDTLIVSDVFGPYNASGCSARAAFPANANEYYKVMIVCIKGNTNQHAGGFINVPDVGGLITELLRSHKSKDAPLFASWNRDSTLKLVREYATLISIDKLGYAIDIHSLRCGGTVHMTERGIEPGQIRCQAKWVPNSDMINHYAGTMTPTMKQLLAAVTLERERMEYSRKITSSRTQSSNNKLQARRIYMSRGTSCASIDSLPEGEPEDGFFEGSDDDDDDEREAAFVTNATVEEVDAALGDATGARHLREGEEVCAEGRRLHGELRRVKNDDCLRLLREQVLLPAEEVQDMRRNAQGQLPD